MGTFYPFFKRLLDIIASVAALLILTPIILPVAIAIRIESPGSAFFLQTRTGQQGRHYKIWKFRSMVQNAPAIGSFRTADNDPRITRVGQFLRRTSLDELPQLINVLRGDMSLIGPRPDTPAQETDYTKRQWAERNKVKPGITGLAQISGRSNLTPKRRAACDLYYVRHMNLGLDIAIVIGTIGAVLSRRGTN